MLTAERLLSTRVAAYRRGQYHECMNLGFPEMIFLFFLALIIFGPKKLPEIGRQIGKAINEFKRASNEFKAQIEHEINQLDVETQRQTILPPAAPPTGAMPARHSVLEAAPAEPAAASEPAALPEPNPVAKAPDA
jgi:TatA/E family protein of Tat protein translocase